MSKCKLTKKQLKHFDKWAVYNGCSAEGTPFTFNEIKREIERFEKELKK